METVYIHADESCLGNQKQTQSSPGGAGGLVEIWKDDDWERRDFWLSEPDTTNNRMALSSAIEPLSSLNRRCRIILTSDSQYLVKGINEWRHGWKRAGWKRKAGEILNLDLWKQLDILVEQHEVFARWVRGHDGHPENEYVDFLATTAAADQSTSGGLTNSGFIEWLCEQRENGKFLDYMEFQRPENRFGS